MEVLDLIPVADRLLRFVCCYEIATGIDYFEFVLLVEGFLVLLFLKSSKRFVAEGLDFVVQVVEIELDTVIVALH